MLEWAKVPNWENLAEWKSSEVFVTEEIFNCVNETNLEMVREESFEFGGNKFISSQEQSFKLHAAKVSKTCESGKLKVESGKVFGGNKVETSKFESLK